MRKASVFRGDGVAAVRTRLVAEAEAEASYVAGSPRLSRSPGPTRPAGLDAADALVPYRYAAERDDLLRRMSPIYWPQLVPQRLSAVLGSSVIARLLVTRR